MTVVLFVDFYIIIFQKANKKKATCNALMYSQLLWI